MGILVSIAIGLAVLTAVTSPPSGRSPSADATATASVAASSLTLAPSVTVVRTARPSPSATTIPPLDMAELLAGLVVVPVHREGYDRDLFPHWTDVDGDGCNTRFEVLISEAVVPPTVAGSCDLTGGTWVSPYDGLSIDGAEGVQIDHVVALAEAWYSGAFAWTTDHRQRFANDLAPDALAAVAPDVNQAKAASDPADWVPPLPSAVCPYAVDWMTIKHRWQLSIDAEERKALLDLVSRCTET